MTNPFSPKTWTFYAVMLALCIAAGPRALRAKEGGGTKDAKKMAAAVKRDPFWPVGYMPEKLKEKTAEKEVSKKNAASATGWNKAMRKIVINGVSSRSSNEFYAVINGQIKSVGDAVTVKYEGTIYTWAVDSIKPPGSVKLRRVSAR